MSLKDAYKQKIEAEIELAQAKMEEFKARVKSTSADAHIKYSKHLEELDGMAHTAGEKLTELGQAGDDTWEALKDGVETAWTALHAAIESASDKFKTEHAEHDAKQDAKTDTKAL